MKAKFTIAVILSTVLFAVPAYFYGEFRGFVKGIDECYSCHAPHKPIVLKAKKPLRIAGVGGWGRIIEDGSKASSASKVSGSSETASRR
ncbi:MAG: hypothetical protein Q8J64_06425 [Thermodesulfovibrionales bacterium]|nr:hypothetical protein [Thermodesulfovibrionales bacterium]